MRGSTALIMNAAGTVTGLTTDVLGIFAGRLQTGVRGGVKIPHRVGMALFAALIANECGARDLGRQDDCASYRSAGNNDRSQDETKQKQQCPSAAAPPKRDQSTNSFPWGAIRRSLHRLPVPTIESFSVFYFSMQRTLNVRDWLSKNWRKPLFP